MVHRCIKNHVRKVMACSFGIESMARDYHEYKSVWEDPVHGEELNCTRDIGNSHDPMVVAILKEIDGVTVTVGHVPRRISALCSVFRRRGGTIRCIVNGDRRYSAKSRGYAMFGSSLAYFKLFSWRKY